MTIRRSIKDSNLIKQRPQSHTNVLIQIVKNFQIALQLQAVAAASGQIVMAHLEEIV